MLSWMTGGPSPTPDEDYLEGGSLVDCDEETQLDIGRKLADLHQRLGQEREAKLSAVRKLSAIQASTDSSISAQMEQVFNLQRENNDLNWRLSELDQAGGGSELIRALREDLADAHELVRAQNEDRVSKQYVT